VPTRRTILLIAAAVTGLAVLAIVIVFATLNGIVRRVIEQRGSSITQTAVRVDSVSVSLRDGTATLHGLTIANPPGFTTPNAFTLGEITVRVTVDTLLSDPLVIDEIRVASPHVTYELNAAGQSNIDAIRHAVENAGGATPGSTRSGGSEGSGAERRLIINLLTLRDGEVRVDARAIGGPEQSETLPGFELTNIGVKEGGATPDEVGRIVVTALARDVAVAVAATQLERYVGRELGGKASDLLKKGGTEAIQKGLGGVLDSLLGK